MIEKLPQTINRQQHHVVQTQAGQGFQLAARPAHTVGQKTFRSWHGQVRAGQTADAPQQAFGLQTCAIAFAAQGVRTVLGQQHADVHFVGLGFQILKETLHAIPLLVPLSVPVGRAVHYPIFLLVGQLVPSGVARNACAFRVPHQIILTLLPRRSLHGFDGPHAQCQFVIRNHQAIVDTNDPTEAFAHRAGACGRVE